LARESTIQLLVVSDGPEHAERVASLMRGVGYAVKTKRVDDKEDLPEAVQNGPYHLALHVLDQDEVEVSDTIEALKDSDELTPVMVYGEGDPSSGKALRLGATDRIAGDDEEHLRRAIVREFERVRTLRRVRYLEDAYQESEQRARALMESSRDAIAYIHDGMHVLANDAYLSRFGYDTFEQIEGMPMIDMVIDEDQKKLKEFLRKFSASEEAVGNLDLRLQQGDGDSFHAEVEFSRASIAGEGCSQIVIRDQGSSEELEELEKQVAELSQRDNVTGLYNRQHFTRELQEQLKRCEQSDKQAAMLQLELDEFEKIKNSVGVIGADQVIADIAKVIQSTVGENDTVARFDGATYAILTPTGDKNELEALATRLRRTLKDHICDVEGTSVSVTCTIGIARMDGSTADPNDVLTRAERALAEAQDRGADNHRIYEPKEGELSQKEIDQQWVEKIKEVLKNDGITLFYQPVVSLADDSTPRYEVQPRVPDDKGSPVEDPEFMAAAERTGMSKGVDRWVVLNSLKALVEELKVDRNTIFFVPISGNAFEDPQLFQWIKERVGSLKLPEGRLVFQVDAGATATRIKHAAAFATAVHSIGCRVCLSGFGHGADPFQVTRHVAVDYIRISEDFVQNIANNQQNKDAVQNIIEQTHEDEKLTICPGVADAGTLTVLWSLGSDLIEGEFLQEASTDRSYDFSAMAM
jgi:diguanylate cyclase (GGDEF)-like protein/PAS domain S-box-containing protein